MTRADTCVLAPFDVPSSAGRVRRGDYIVTVGVRGVGSVYQVLVARRLKSAPEGRARWALRCLRANDMKERVALLSTGEAYIQAANTWTMRWNPRRRQ